MQQAPLHFAVLRPLLFFISTIKRFSRDTDLCTTCLKGKHSDTHAQSKKNSWVDSFEGDTFVYFPGGPCYSPESSPSSEFKSIDDLLILILQSPFLTSGEKGITEEPQPARFCRSRDTSWYLKYHWLKINI